MSGTLRVYRLPKLWKLNLGRGHSILNLIYKTEYFIYGLIIDQ
jgi:hypothetical protein